MRLWWLFDFFRLRLEREAVERTAAQEGWFRLDAWRVDPHRLTAEGAITANGVAYSVRLVYPDQFPLVPAWVEPQDPEARWSSHQYGNGGLLCLELRPDNWTPSATGSDVLRSAFNLLRTENPLGDGVRGSVASAHAVGEVQSYDWGRYPVLIGEGCLDRLKAGAAEDVRALRWAADDDVWPIMVSDVVDRSQPQYPSAFDLGTLRFEVPVSVGRGSPPEPTPPDRQALAQALGLEPIVGGDGPLVVLAVNNDLVTPYHSTDPGSVFERRLVVLADQAGLRSGRANVAKGRSVAIVGVGSVGSKVTEMLLRSGIHQFVLVDGDVLLPANLERHTLDWRDVGFRKAHAVKRRLLHIVSGADVHVVPVNLDWQRSARSHAAQVEGIAGCDVIIDATGDVPMSLMLGALAAVNGKPFLSVEVFEGGLGCLVARSLPGRDAAYVSGRNAYSAYCEERSVPPPPSGRRSYESLTDAGEPLVADDAAVTMAAAHAARVALDVLDGRVGSSDAAWLLFGFREGWLFDGHGHTIALDVGPAPPPPAVLPDDPETREFAISLAKRAINASDDPQ